MPHRLHLPATKLSESRIFWSFRPGTDASADQPVGGRFSAARMARTALGTQGCQNYPKYSADEAGPKAVAGRALSEGALDRLAGLTYLRRVEELT